jgi:hypothetical protein
LISDGGDGKTVFHAFIGREHPGTQLYKDEVLNIISSVEYITLVEEYATEVSEEAKSEYYTDVLEFQE